MEELNNGGSRPEQAYDNLGAHRELKRLMSKGAQLHLTFGISKKDTIPYAWVESERLEGFKYQINDSGSEWLLNYLTRGDSDDIKVKPEEVKPFKGKIDDILLPIVKAGVNMWKNGEECIIKRVPMFRDRPGNVSLSITTIFARCFFRLERTEELLEYLSESGLDD